jgi:hypothetical protein|tara:strand:- start:184 stop:300 length:117 start_codon:yes stop_codon:yes gene_type:complete
MLPKKVKALKTLLLKLLKEKIPDRKRSRKKPIRLIYRN